MATKEQIMDRVTRYNQAVTEVRQDLTLSPLGKYQALARLYEAARDEVDRMRGTLDQNTNGDRRTLERELFGLPAGSGATDVVSFRDATDRVSAAKTDTELGELMERAAGVGDDLLVRAGFARAWQESRKPLAGDGWNGLVDEYLGQNPRLRPKAERLQELTSSRGATAAFSERMSMTVSRPRELDRNEGSLSSAAPVRPTPDLMTR